MKTCIILYEDNASLRESIKTLLSYDERLLLMDSFEDANDVEAQVNDIKPDVILMDIDMPGRNGIEAVKLIRRFNTRVEIMMLTVFDDNEHVFNAICAGASGYILKKHISESLPEAIFSLMRREAPMSPAIARLVIESIQHRNKPSPEYDLTEREAEILSKLAQGNSFKKIAEALFIGVETVRTHARHIYEKLQVHSQAEAVSKALQERLV